MKRWWIIMLIALGVMACAARPAAAVTLFGLVDTGELFASADNGATWSIRSTLPVDDAVALAAGATTSELYLLSRSGACYRSTDAGLNWTAVGTITASDVVDLSVRADGALLALTATGSIYRSTDQGATFTALAALTGSNFVSLARGPGTTTLYALTATGEVSKSVDNGSSWTAVGTITTPDAVKTRHFSGALYVLNGAGDVYKSTDAGATWVAVGTLSQVGMTGLAVTGAQLAAVTKEGHVAVSSNGASWAWQGSINQLNVMALGVDSPYTTGVEQGLPSGTLALATPYPNPQSGSRAGTFRFTLPRAGVVRLALFDLVGRRVAERAPQAFDGGSHAVTWDPGPLRPGLYLSRLMTDSGGKANARWVVLR